MSKKLIMMIAAAGLVSFVGAFVFAWQTCPSPTRKPPEPNRAALAEQETELSLPQPEVDTTGITITGDSTMKKALTEKQLKNLVYEVQQRMQEYEHRLQSLQQQEKRLQIAQDTLRKDTENLDNLRIELASIVVGVKEQRDKLLASRVEIAQAEKVNLAKIAATYDKMDATSASKILTSMCKDKLLTGSGTASAENNMNDAVKILHYMTERTKAKLLSELVTSEPELAAVLCKRLKQVVEKQ